jgi:D-serine deaminase-like pyridoxal phosphate-dependent protein
MPLMTGQSKADALRELARQWTSFTAFAGDELVTPALVIDAEAVEHNVRTVVDWIGDPARWRPHVKTAKLPWAIERLLTQGVRRFKCATTVELAMLIESGAPDVLFAMCARKATGRAVADLAASGPSAVSVLVEGPDDLREWAGVPVGVFIDVDSGYGRTGIPVADVSRIVALAREAVARGLRFEGLHAYEGWPPAPHFAARRQTVAAGLDGLVAVVEALASSGIEAREVVTSGSMTASWTRDHAGLAGAVALHSLSPGTVVYHDIRTELDSPWPIALRPAAAVLTRIVSSASATHVTCDAGHKAVAADVGDPIGLVAGRPDLELLSPSEEHLPLRVQAGSRPPRRGETLAVVPMHVCPTINLHDVALLVRDGTIEQALEVAARGHQDPTRTAWRRDHSGHVRLEGVT